MEKATEQGLTNLWKKLRHVPGGSYLFNRALAAKVPYTGSISPRVTKLEPGHAIVEMRDCKRVRNHLNSIHAMALANLCEAASGLALLSALPSDKRGIVTGFSLKYLKKARGKITAESKVSAAEFKSDGELRVGAVAKDESGDIVAQAEALWKIGSK